jgi:hypothetical protein
VGHALAGLGLDKYAAALAGLGWAELAALSEAELKARGLPKGPRLKLLAAVRLAASSNAAGSVDGVRDTLAPADASAGEQEAIDVGARESDAPTSALGAGGPVGEALAGLGLDNYAAALAGLGWVELAALSEAELKARGLPKGPRLKLLRRAAAAV